MYISVTGDSLSITDFIWFTGTSAVNGTGGSWTVNESPSLPNPLFTIDWVKQTSMVASIQYTYVKPDESATGNFIKYGTKDTTQLNDAYYVLHQQNPVVYDVNIEWNARTKAGRYHDINGWHCWDASKNDINCN